MQNIPDPNDYFKLGEEYLMLAFSGICGLINKIEDLDSIDYLDEEDFIEKLRTKMFNFASLIHQGQDFILKAKICEISPYLLFENNPDKYPKNVDDFSLFHTHDSSKLIKILKTFATNPISNDFENCFEKCRLRRNKLMHSLNLNLQIELTELLKDILLTNYEIIQKPWLELRNEYIEYNEDHIQGGGGVWTNHALAREFTIINDVLSRSEVEKFLGVRKGATFYHCSYCTHNAETYGFDNLHTSYLKPTSSTSTNLFCLICETDSEVTRNKCNNDGCKSNVILNDSDMCALCGEYWSEEE